MPVRCTTAWMTSDGKLFENYEHAQEYEFRRELNKIMDHVGTGGEWDADMFASWIIDNIWPLKNLLDNAPVAFKNNGLISAAEPPPGLAPPLSLDDDEVPF